ncbi:MAG: DUF4230 domain-containing protein [Anaerolineaceae bacterium]|nr:DUF4230 domain-containing protein [Anaerolineaceae bacterium]MCY3907573.1 DUF4230 domain-containing protein [Anaerolineaceae bacterium]
MTNQSQQSSGGHNCLTIAGILIVVLLVTMIVLGVLAWNAVGDLFGGVSQRISGLGESVGGSVGQTLEDLGETVDGIGQGVKDLGESVAAIPQSVSNAVEEVFRNEMRANIETKNLLARSINHMATLVTATQPIETDVEVGVQAGLLNLCGASVNHIVDGTIEAGVDLSKVQGSDFIHDPLTNSWVLRLGSAELHSCRIDYIRQEGHSRTVCQQDWDAYRLLAEAAALREMRYTALAEGLLASAELEAERVLGNFLRNVTESENVSILFESEPVTEIPESCLRELPASWKFDEESDSWVRE